MTYKIPILILCYNRPLHFERILFEVLKYSPNHLYISCDGPKNNKDYDNIMIIKRLVDVIDKKIKVTTRFNNINLGCKFGVIQGINWFFDNENEGIILEDDCLPSQSFFYFSEDLINKYRNNYSISMISGSNFSDGKFTNRYSYYFSRYSHIWGWATWKSRWKNYILNESRDNIDKVINENFGNSHEGRFWRECFMKVYLDSFDTWDYQWVYTNLKLNNLSIMPYSNLVSNIGFDENATHTKNTNSKIKNLEFEKVIFPLNHPLHIKYNKIDDFYSSQIFSEKNILELIMFKIHKIVNLIWK